MRHVTAIQSHTIVIDISGINLEPLNFTRQMDIFLAIANASLPLCCDLIDGFEPCMRL